MIRFGISPVDERLAAPERGRPFQALILSSPGIDPVPYGLHAAFAMIGDGSTCVYLVNNKPPRSVLAQARALGYNLEAERVKERFRIVDAFSPYMGHPAEGWPVVHDQANVAEVREAVAPHMGKDAFLVIDSISSWIDLSGQGSKGVERLLKALGEKWPLFGLFSSWGYGQDTVEAVRDAFDDVVAVRPVEEVAIVRQFLVAEKINGKAAQPLAVPVKLLQPGGVHVYFPKILVTGPQGSGKTTLVSAISSRGISADRLGTTVALDHGYVEYEGITADLYGTPGAEAFDPILKLIADEAVAVVLVVDASRPETFERAKSMLQLAQAQALPIVVAANKSDHKGALSPHEVRQRLKLARHVPVVATEASIGAGVNELLDELIKRLLHDESFLARGAGLRGGEGGEP